MFSLTSTQKQVALQNKIRSLENQLGIATSILQKISEGSHQFNDIHCKPDEDNAFKELVSKTKEKLLQDFDEDQQRNWVGEGMSKFMEVMQGDRNKTDFFDRILSLIVRYAGLNQGGLFILQNEDAADAHLKLVACYAYGKKKFVEKKIAIGQGLLGQAFLEKETSIYTDVPKNYVEITSGLGEATPRFLLLVPLIYDKQVMGVMELAAFKQLEKYKIEFIEKIAESLASVILNLQHTSRSERLYFESQQNAKRLQEQEESLRQNIEELNSTQEEMRRHQVELDQQTYLLKVIVDNIPFPIFVKDEKGRYTLVNKSEARLFNLRDTDLIGKDDSYFVANQDEWQVIQESDERVLESDEPLELPVQHFTTPNGTSYIFKTTKIPFINNITGKKNILGVSIDLTEKHALETKLSQERKLNVMNTLANVAGRQRMLSQKIGFYAEMVAKGKIHHATELKACVELYEHSLKVITEGGFPSGIHSEEPLPEADISLLPYIKEIEKVWRHYREAARRVLFYVTFEEEPDAPAKSSQIHESLNFIEENAEVLLKRNDDLMLACIHLNEEELYKV